MKERPKMSSEHFELTFDNPTNQDYDYRNHLYTHLVNNFIEKSYEFCKNLPTEENLEKIADKKLNELWKDDQEWNGLIATGEIPLEQLVIHFIEEILSDVPMSFDIEEDEEKWNKMKQERIDNLVQRLVKFEKKTINK
jgi:hypothetical protein